MHTRLTSKSMSKSHTHVLTYVCTHAVTHSCARVFSMPINQVYRHVHAHAYLRLYQWPMPCMALSTPTVVLDVQMLERLASCVEHALCTNLCMKLSFFGNGDVWWAYGSVLGICSGMSMNLGLLRWNHRRGNPFQTANRMHTACLCACLCTGMYIFIYKCLYTCLYTFCTDVYTHVSTHFYIDVCMHVCTYFYADVYM